MPRGKTIKDEMLVQAIRQRILDEIQRRHEQQIVNNVYGGGGQQSLSQGVGEQLGHATDEEDPYDYFVDITRRDTEDINPATGKPLGWDKKVHRFRKKKVSPGPEGPQRELKGRG